MYQPSIFLSLSPSLSVFYLCTHQSSVFLHGSSSVDLSIFHHLCDLSFYHLCCLSHMYVCVSIICPSSFLSISTSLPSTCHLFYPSPVCVRVICLSLSAYLRDLSTYYDFLCTVYLSIFLSVCLSISLSFCHLSGHRNTLVSALEFELLESKLQAFLAFSPHQ